MLERELALITRGNLKAYGDKARSLLFNLMNEKNPHLRLRLLLVSPWENVTPLTAKQAVSDPKALAS